MTTRREQRHVEDGAVDAARQILYRWLSIAFSDPRHGSWEELQGSLSRKLVREGVDLLRAALDSSGLVLLRGERPLEELDAEKVLELLPRSESAWNDLYERTFGLLVTGPCPAHETDYLPEKYTFQRSHALADVSGFYRAFGLRPSRSRPERHDHISLELEFPAFVIGLERRAFMAGGQHGPERVGICRRAQRRFLVEHLAWWTPTFARLLELEQPGGFYAVTGRLLASFIPFERRVLGVETLLREAAMPSLIERPESCDGCVFSGAS